VQNRKRTKEGRNKTYSGGEASKNFKQTNQNEVMCFLGRRWGKDNRVGTTIQQTKSQQRCQEEKPPRISGKKVKKLKDSNLQWKKQQVWEQNGLGEKGNAS